MGAPRPTSKSSRCSGCCSWLGTTRPPARLASASCTSRGPRTSRRLREQPSLIPSAISEFLRYETPVMGMPRTATRDFERYGRRVAKGEQVFLVWAAANRDPQVFSRPDECVIDRRPNRHLVFGRGIHACIGRGLAEMELRAAVEEVLARTRWISLGSRPA